MKQTTPKHQTIAVAKSVSHSPRKVSEVAALVRRRSVQDALVILEHTPRRAATAVYKVVASAAANAEHNDNLQPKTLVIDQISVTAGPRIKRYRPASRGRALPFQRKTSHIRVVVSGDKRQNKAAQKKTKTTNKKEAK